MKRIFFIFSIFFISLMSFAQDHIKIFGHCIDEPHFIRTLMNEGKISVNKDQDGYSCNFAGKDSYIYFVKIKGDESKIFKIYITGKKYENWTNLKDTYYHYQALFKEKYIMEQHFERTGIRAGSSLSENEYALHYIKQGDGVFISKFIIPNGELYLTISPKEGSDYPELGEVVIEYYDTINSNIQSSQTKQSNMDDI